MTNRTHTPSARKRDLYRSRPLDPRYEIVFRNRPSPRNVFANLLSGLKAIAERGGEWVGDAYAVAARNLLGGWERLEDLNAERKFRRRVTTAPSAEVPTPGLAIPKDEIASTHRASV